MKPNYYILMSVRVSEIFYVSLHLLKNKNPYSYSFVSLKRAEYVANIEIHENLCFYSLHIGE